MKQEEGIESHDDNVVTGSPREDSVSAQAAEARESHGALWGRTFQAEGTGGE